MNIYNPEPAPVITFCYFFLHVAYISIQYAYIQVLTCGIDSSRHVDTPRYLTFFIIPFGSRDTVSRSWWRFQILARFWGIRRFQITKSYHRCRVSNNRIHITVYFKEVYKIQITLSNPIHTIYYSILQSLRHRIRLSPTPMTTRYIQIIIFQSSSSQQLR